MAEGRSEDSIDSGSASSGKLGTETWLLISTWKFVRHTLYPLWFQGKSYSLMTLHLLATNRQSDLQILAVLPAVVSPVLAAGDERSRPLQNQESLVSRSDELSQPFLAQVQVLDQLLQAPVQQEP